MKKFVYFALFALLVLSSCTSTKTTVERSYTPPTAEQRLNSIAGAYDVETVGIGKDGTYLIRVTDNFSTTDEEVYIDGLKKDAVHCVIFKGIPAGKGSLKQPALRTEDTKIEGTEEAFIDFFKQGQYLQFVGSIVNSSKSITRVKSTKDFKISLTVSVNKDELRKYLTENNMIKSLDFIF